MPTSEEARDWLAHHGVIGMHWGQHTDRVAARTAAIERHQAREKGLAEDFKKIQQTKDRVERKKMLAAYSKKETVVYNHPDAKVAVNHYLKNQAIGVGVGTAVYIGARRGAAYLSAHPEVITRAGNLLKNRKAITTGHEIVKLALKNGVWA